jgi:hypothetical protein
MDSVARGVGTPAAQALVGQLLLVCTGIGLFIGGTAVSAVGLTGVFVPSDWSSC